MKQRMDVQMLVFLWMTRSITDDIPGWGVLFNDLAGDGTVSVSLLHWDEEARKRKWKYDDDDVTRCFPFCYFCICS